MINVLITDNCHPILIERLVENGFKVDYLPHISLEDIDKIIANYKGIIINTRVRMDQKRIDLGTGLRFIGRMGSGLDIIDLKHAASRNIKIISSPEGNAQAVAEHSLSMLLALLNKLPLGASQVKNLEWNRENARGRELSGLTVGIVGYGHTGSAFAQVLAGFDIKIKVYDKYKEVQSQKIYKAELYPASLQEICSTCDIISFNIPLTDETALLIDEPFINKLKAGIILINTSRGGIADLNAIRAGLETGKIAGCCLDVFPNEKPETYSLHENEIINTFSVHPAVIMTPHVAGWTIESKEKIANVLVEKILQNISTN